MNITQLQILVALVETGNFTEAAASIHLTQSAASHALSKLEAELGVTLLKRERNGVTPTEMGKEALHHARGILEHIETLQQKASIARGLAVGKLRFGSIPPLLSAHLLTGIISHFQRIYPEAEIIVLEGTKQEIGEWLEEGIIDVGFVIPGTQDLDSIPISRDELQVCVPADHPLASQTSIKVTDLANEPFIMAKIGGEVIEPLLLERGQKRLNIRYMVSESRTILTMVRERLGCTIIPKMLCEDSFEGVHALRFDPPLIFDIGLGVRSFKTASPLTKLFIEQAQTWAQTHGFAPKEVL
ncbi:MAG: LysR family transcriptional regulator [Chloroflexota bacterium]